MVRVRSVRCLEDFRVELGFTDGEVRILDLTPYLRGQVFSRHRDEQAFFRAVRVDPGERTIVWPDGTDLDPDVLGWGLRPDSWDARERRPHAFAVPRPRAPRARPRRRRGGVPLPGAPPPGAGRRLTIASGGGP
jgi:hypothetical protein